MSVRAEIESLMSTYGAKLANTNIPPTMCAYFTGKNYIGADGFAVKFKDYPNILPIDLLSAEIYFDNPCLLGFHTYFGAPHMTTAIGYGVIDNVEYAVVRDTYSSTEADRWVELSESDWLISFTPPNLS